MAATISHYLNIVKANLRLDRKSESEFLDELETHIEDELAELESQGLSKEEATEACVKLLGSAKLIAHQIYEAHSQGSWRQVLLASMPHLLFGLLFALNWWQYIGWLSIMLTLFLTVAVYGWWRGKPAWLFPWLGYTLLPVVVAGLFLLYLPRGWAWLTILLYIPFAVWLIYCVAIQTIKRDWLHGSLTLLPVPIIAGWLLAVKLDGRFAEFSISGIRDLAPWIGLSFLALGATAAAFIRLRQRWLKAGLIFVSGMLIIAMIVYFAGSRLSLSDSLILLFTVPLLLLVPALLEYYIRDKQWLRLPGKASNVRSSNCS